MRVSLIYLNMRPTAFLAFVSRLLIEPVPSIRTRVFTIYSSIDAAGLIFVKNLRTVWSSSGLAAANK